MDDDIEIRNLWMIQMFPELLLGNSGFDNGIGQFLVHLDDTIHAIQHQDHSPSLAPHTCTITPVLAFAEWPYLKFVSVG